MTPASAGLVLGRVAGHRGADGEFTVRVASGDASRWTGLRHVVLEPGDEGGGTVCRIETARAYRDRLVLKLEGIDDANAAAALRGRTVAVAEDEVPELPEGRYWLDHLLGLEVVDERAGSLGRVEDVIETGGGEVLVVRPMDGEDGEEILIPLVRRYVRGIEEEDGTIRTDVPEDLLDLNRGG